jgi:hypothetical protein
VLTAIDGINLLGPASGVVWRGQADIDWRLESKAGRQGLDADAMRSHEQAMLGEARRIGADGAQYMGDWEILARLRHHGASTRLIDCTTDPYVALWFLCDDDAQVPDGGSVRDRDGALLALQRNQFTKIDKPWMAESYKDAMERTPAPLLYSTPPIDPRIAAQRGVFVLHTRPESSERWPSSELGLITEPTHTWTSGAKERLDDLCGGSPRGEAAGRPQIRFPNTLGVVVPHAVKRMLLDMLQTNFGFDRSTIFPDFAGMGEYFSTPRR